MRAEWLFLLLFTTLPLLSAPIQQAWSIRYHGAALSTNLPVAMTLDPAGNLILAGSSTGPNGDYDYVTMKYSTNGTLLWRMRYSSIFGAKDQVQAMTVDSNGNVYVTGTSSTVKYDGNGQQLWTAPYAGKALAVDTNLNVFVTGFSTNDFATVKLSGC